MHANTTINCNTVHVCIYIHTYIHTCSDVHVAIATLQGKYILFMKGLLNDLELYVCIN